MDNEIRKFCKVCSLGSKVRFVFFYVIVVYKYVVCKLFLSVFVLISFTFFLLIIFKNPLFTQKRVLFLYIYKCLFSSQTYFIFIDQISSSWVGGVQINNFHNRLNFLKIDNKQIVYCLPYYLAINEKAYMYLHKNKTFQ